MYCHNEHYEQILEAIRKIRLPNIKSIYLEQLENPNDKNHNNIQYFMNNAFPLQVDKFILVGNNRKLGNVCIIFFLSGFDIN
jgi:hypothetical protein